MTPPRGYLHMKIIEQQSILAREIDARIVLCQYNAEVLRAAGDAASVRREKLIVIDLDHQTRHRSNIISQEHALLT